MIFSSKHKFIFIKGRKVAGTSIEMALSPLCGPQDIITPISPVDELKRLSLGGQPQNYSRKSSVEAEYLGLVRAGKVDAAVKTRVHSDKVYPFYNHMPLTAVETLLNPPSREYTLVYAVRSPYEKVASLANMYLSFNKYSGKPMENSIEDIRESIRLIFESGQYILAKNYALYQSDKPYKARIILRHEHLASDFQNVLPKLGIRAEQAELPHAKQGSVARGYLVENMLTRAQLDLINTEFSDEFLAHKYQKI